MLSTLLPLPSATTTIALAGQDVSIWFDQLSPLLVLLGIPVAVAILGMIIYVIISGFNALTEKIKETNSREYRRKERYPELFD